MKRTLVIGDVHGCSDELAALLAACGHSEDDDVVLVGDLVSKGPDSKGVLELARSVGARAVRGNHDQAVIRWREAVARGEPAPELRRSHQAVADALDDADFEWLCALPFWVRLPEHAAIVVHAGIVPGVPLEKQRHEDLLNMRSVMPDGRGSPRLERGVPWASVWPGPEHILFGHDAMRGLQEHPHATGLDTGCVYGRALTACILPDHRLVSVPARHTYREPRTSVPPAG